MTAMFDKDMTHYRGDAQTNRAVIASRIAKLSAMLSGVWEPEEVAEWFVLPDPRLNNVRPCDYIHNDKGFTCLLGMAEMLRDGMHI